MLIATWLAVLLVPVSVSAAVGSDAQQRPDSGAPQLKSVSPLLSLFAADARSITSDPYTYGLVSTMLLSPMLLDEDPPSVSQPWVASQGADYAFEFGDAMGNGWSAAALIAGSFAIGKLSGSMRFSAVASDLARAQFMNGLLTASIKVITDRTRPDGAPYSFPSGHTSAAFATASVINRYFGKYWGGLSYAAAAYVGVSRLQENKHYISDVAAGALLGLFVASRTTPALKSKQKTLHLTLEVPPGLVGLGVGYRF